MKIDVTLLPITLPSFFPLLHNMSLSNGILPLDLLIWYQSTHEDGSILVSLVHHHAKMLETAIMLAETYS